jgi:hypothetical protein
MPAIPESTRSSILLRLLDHAEHNWPQLAKVQARYHGSFAYITGVLPGGEQIPLFRLRYGGSAHSFGFAIYSPARDRYEDAVLLTGLPIGSPQEALDTACTLHLAALGHEPESWPPTNLRGHPLSYCKLYQKVYKESGAECSNDKKSSADEFTEPAYELYVRAPWQSQRDRNILQPSLHLRNIIEHSAENSRHADAHCGEEEQEKRQIAVVPGVKVRREIRQAHACSGVEPDTDLPN